MPFEDRVVALGIDAEEVLVERTRPGCVAEFNETLLAGDRSGRHLLTRERRAGFAQSATIEMRS
jgi:hypothetical protein